MTKTLTEQWREGTLQLSRYYAKFADGSIDNITLSSSISLYESEHIKEVLAPVPSYDEWKQAKENLDKNGTWYTERSYKELVSKNEQLVQKMHILENQFADLSKKVEHLQEQLNEANKVIKKYSDGTIYLFPTWYNGSRLAEAYLEKWGVK